MWPVPISCCCCIYPIVSVICPPIHFIELVTCIHNEQEIGNHFWHCFRVPFPHGSHIDGECFHPLSDGIHLVFFGLMNSHPWISTKQWGPPRGSLASCVLVWRRSSVRSIYSHLYIQSSSFLGMVSKPVPIVTRSVVTCCCDMPCSKAAN